MPEKKERGPVELFDFISKDWDVWTHYMITVLGLNANIDKAKLSKHPVLDFFEFKTLRSKQTGKTFLEEWKWKYPHLNEPNSIQRQQQ